MKPRFDRVSPDTVCYLLLLGSNVRKEESLPAGRAALAKRYDLLAESRVCDSEAVGAPGTPRFYNQAVWVCTTDRYPDVKTTLRGIEKDLGRVRTADPNAPRTMDLDVVLAMDATGEVLAEPPIDEDLLTCHHICVPAAEIAGDVFLDTAGRTIAEIATQLPPAPSSFRILPATADEHTKG